MSHTRLLVITIGIFLFRRGAWAVPGVAEEINPSFMAIAVIWGYAISMRSTRRIANGILTVGSMPALVADALACLVAESIDTIWVANRVIAAVSRPSHVTLTLIPLGTGTMVSTGWLAIWFVA